MRSENPQSVEGVSSRCTVIVREVDHEHSIQAQADGYRERVSIVETAVELGIIEYDTGTQTIQLDEAAAALHGLTDQLTRSLPVDSWAALLVQDDQLRAHTLLISGVAIGQTERMTVRLAGSDPKKPRLLELALRSAPDGSRLVGACRDVTRERSLEALRRQKLTAERASKAKSEFMSHVSHELRTPLNAILGFAQLMTMDQDHPLAKPHRERLEMVQHSGKRLLGLIDQLLQITKIERGKAALRAKSVNVRAVIRHCVDTLELMALERGVEITVDIERPELSAVRADPDALEQVMINLLSNAIKYNRDHGRVRISFRAGELGELTVDDTGKGLSDSQLGRMFEPFDRLDAEKSAVAGTGLGLVITKQLIEAMGGRLEVWSQVGKGSRFKIELPLARGSRDPTSNTLPLEFPSQWDTGKEYSVLYIEDDEVNVVLMEQLFSTQPEWRLQCAATGVEGLTAAVRRRPHVILLDMKLPDMQGIDVFRRLKDDPRTCDIPCVAVSADALPAHINRVHALGFEDYWTKPLDLPATIGKLKRLLR
jgi:signal transduction histidine kinase